MKKQKGSYTIEAAIYVPMILFLMIQAMQLGIGFLGDAKTMLNQDAESERTAVGEFYLYQIGREIGEELLND